MWSHHNYRDFDTPLSSTRASIAQGILQGRWHGYWEDIPGVASAVASVMLTEGGVNIKTIQNDVNRQRDLIQAAYDRLHNDTVGQGRGIGMFAQYLYYTDSIGANAFDSGLIDPQGSARPAYATFKSFPSI